MKRYRLLKELPGFKVGHIETTETSYIMGYSVKHYPDFFEEVKEKEFLEGKFYKLRNHEIKCYIPETSTLVGYNYSANSFELSNIAKEHYLKLFDEAAKEYKEHLSEYGKMWIREKLEQG